LEYTSDGRNNTFARSKKGSIAKRYSGNDGNGRSKKENVLLAIQSGTNNYIVKPFTAETLKDKLEKV
jgi:hypothetical protein